MVIEDGWQTLCRPKAQWQLKFGSVLADEEFKDKITAELKDQFGLVKILCDKSKHDMALEGEDMTVFRTIEGEPGTWVITGQTILEVTHVNQQDNSKWTITANQQKKHTTGLGVNRCCQEKSPMTKRPR